MGYFRQLLCINRAAEHCKFQLYFFQSELSLSQATLGIVISHSVKSFEIYLAVIYPYNSLLGLFISHCDDSRKNDQYSFATGNLSTLSLTHRSILGKFFYFEVFKVCIFSSTNYYFLCLTDFHVFR